MLVVPSAVGRYSLLAFAWRWEISHNLGPLWITTSSNIWQGSTQKFSFYFNNLLCLGKLFCLISSLLLKPLVLRSMLWLFHENVPTTYKLKNRKIGQPRSCKICVKKHPVDNGIKLLQACILKYFIKKWKHAHTEFDLLLRVILRIALYLQTWKFRPVKVP